MWIVLALSSALISSFSSIFRKTAINGEKDYHLIPFVIISLLLPINLASGGFFLLYSHNTISLVIVGLTILSGLVNLCSMFMHYRANKLADVSRVEPLGALLPVFSIFTSMLILNEIPNIWGIIGITLVSLGAIYLNTHKIKLNNKSAVRDLFKSKASFYMLGTVAVWSLTSVLDKYIITYIHPAVYVWWLEITMLIGLLVIYRPSKKRVVNLYKRKKLPILFLACLASLSMFAQLFAMKGANISYVLALRRMDALFVVILGHFLLKETQFKKRISAAVIMLAGATIITLSV